MVFWIKSSPWLSSGLYKPREQGCHGIAGMDWKMIFLSSTQTRSCSFSAQAPPGIMSATIPWGKIEFFFWFGGSRYDASEIPETTRIFFKVSTKIYGDMNTCNIVCLYVSFMLYGQCVLIFAQGHENCICLLNHRNMQYFSWILNYSSIMELRESVDWNSLQFTGFLIPLTLQLHRVFQRARSASSSVLELILMALLGKKKREDSFVWPGAVFVGTEIWFCSRRAAETGKAAPDFHFPPVAGEGWNPHIPLQELEHLCKCHKYVK